MRRRFTFWLALAFCGGVAPAAGAGLGGIQIGEPEAPTVGVKMPQPERSKVIVRGCRSEDTCRINYRPSGDWAITRRQP